MKSRKVSLIIFYDKDKRILLQDRTGISKWGEEWGFFGGAVEKDETPEQTLVRETKEELSFDLKEFEYIEKFESNVSDDFKVIAHLFVSPLNNNLKRFRQKEGKSMKLFSLDEAENLKMVPKIDKLILKALREYFEL
jgi:8-oxo-dGTP diphosphatase